jgi:hypothetical protein
MNPFEYSFDFNKKICSSNSHSPIGKLTEHLFTLSKTSVKYEANKKLALNVILSNLITAFINNRYLSVSRTANDYSLYSFYGLNHYTFRIIIGWFDLLLKNEYVKLARGFYNPENNTGKKSRYWVTEKFISELNSVLNNSQEFTYCNYKRPVVLKDRNKNLIKFTASRNIQDKISFINDYNELLDNTQITIPVNSNSLSRFNNSYPFINQYLNIYNVLLTELVINNREDMREGIPLLITIDPNHIYNKKLSGQLYRVFNNGKFTEGGRFYGAEYQQLSENDRKKILINGSPTTEIDFSGFHLNLLYHKSNKHFEKDPYTSVNDIPDVRKILKLISLVAINAKDKSQALRAIQDEITSAPELTRLKREFFLDVKNLLRKFESVHFQISNYFFNDTGIKLQYIDSQIAEAILRHFTSQDIPCLCIHDSFIVQEMYKDELSQVMNEVYKKFANGNNAKLKFS